MVPQQFQKPEPSKMSVFMEKVGLPIILVVATILGSIISAIIAGTTHIISFTWLLLFWGCTMLGIVVFFAWYSTRTRQILQEQYDKYIAQIKSDVQTFKNDHRQMREEETRHWNEWAVSFSAQADKEHRERTDELKGQCMEAIHDVELRLDVSVKNAQTMFSGAFDSNRIAVELYKERLIHAQKQMEALEERLRKGSLPESQE